MKSSRDRARLTYRRSLGHEGRPHIRILEICAVRSALRQTAEDACVEWSEDIGAES